LPNSKSQRPTAKSQWPTPNPKLPNFLNPKSSSQRLTANGQKPNGPVDIVDIFFEVILSVQSKISSQMVCFHFFENILI
jgi:hypothetical protein